MSGIAYLAAVLLAAVFATAGVAKLRAPRRTTATFAALGLPAPAGLARAVPLGELALAVLLLAAPAVGGALALAALAGFTTLLVRSLQAGLRVDCGCFGSAGDEPMSFVEVTRNGLLAVLAAGALFASGPSTPALADIILVSTAALVGLLVLALSELRRDVGAVWDNTLAGEAVR